MKSSGHTINIRVSDRDELTKMNFTGSFNVQRFIDKILQQTKLSRDSVKVLFKGR
jgi:hypothetical protein